MSWWLWANVFAMDAPIIAAVWQRFFANVFATPLSWWATLSLASIVWGGYLLDRVLDARHTTEFTARHQFARRNRQWMQPLAFSLLVSGLSLGLAMLPRELVLAGLLVSALITVYFLLVHWLGVNSRYFGKEWLVGVCFSLGVSVPLFAGAARAWPFWLPTLVAFAALAGWNCRLIDIWEHPQPFKNFAWEALSATLLLSVCCLFVPTAIALALLSSLMMHWLLHALKSSMSPSLRRVLVDLALLTPMFFWELPALIGLQTSSSATESRIV